MSRRVRHDWLLSRLASNRLRARGGRATTNAFPYHRRLRIEPLEARQLLANVTVGNSLDVVNGNTSSIANLISTPGTDGISLREAVLAANATAGTDTVLFSSPFTITLGGTEIEITEALTIDARPLAQNATINAKFLSRVFSIAATTGDFTFGGLTLTGGKTISSGGAIDSLTTGNLTFDRSVITVNNSVGRGGGVRASGDATFNRSTVVGNHTTGLEASGGGVYAAGDVTLTQSSVSGNTTIGQEAFGGGIEAGGNVTLQSSNVDGNLAASEPEGGVGGFSGSSGGGISAVGDVTLIDSSLSGNTSGSIGGGLITQGEVTLNNSTVTRNVGKNGAGGISAPNAGVMLYDSTVTGNSGRYGGGIAAFGDVTLTRSSVDGNSANGSFGGGGGIHSNGDVVLNGSSVAGNFAKAKGGGINANGDVVLTQSSINGNVTNGEEAEGGGIFARGTVSLTDSTISENRISGFLSWGGGIATRGNVSLVRSQVSGNGTDGSAGIGGGIYAGGNVTLTLSTVSGNSTTGSGAHGGGIIADGNVTLNQSTVSGNSTVGINAGGGGISAVGSVTLLQSTVSGNRTSGQSAHGGGIRVVGNVTITQSTVTNNAAVHANSYAGAVLQTNPSLSNFPIVVRDSIVAGNTSGTGFVELLRDAQSTLTIDYSIIGTTIIPTSGSNNISTNSPQLGPLADNGGPTQTHALLVGSPAIDKGDPNIAFSPAEFDQRGAPFVRVIDGDGTAGPRIDIGAFEQQPYAGVQFVVDTSADENDGNHTPGDLSLREAIGLANTTPGVGDVITFAASLSGQTITLGGTALPIVGSLLIDARTLASGLTVSANNASRIFEITGEGFDVTLAGLTLTGGRTTGSGFESQGGGAIRSLMDLTLIETTVHGNSITGNSAAGGGIWASGRVSLVRSTVRGNSTSGSDSRGGGIRASTAIITDSTVSGNSTTGANSGGGGMIAGVVTLLRSTISGNSTAGSGANGGGIFTFGGTVTIDQSTVTNNHAAQASGGGLFQDTFLDYPVVVSGSIFAGNTAASAPDLVKDALGTLAVNYSLIGTAVAPSTGGNNVVTNNPQLSSLADNGGPTRTHAPASGSPAINAGDPNILFSSAEFDQRGTPYTRVASGRIDMGAFEVQAAGPALPGDYNQNNVVDAADYVLWRNTLNQSVTPFSGADGDGNGTIGQGDYNVWRARFGQTLGSASGASAAVTRLASMPVEETKPQSSPNLEGQAEAGDVTTNVHPRSASAAPFLMTPPALGTVTASEQQSSAATSSLALITAPHDDALLAWLASRHLQQERAAGEWSIRPDDPEEESADREVRSESLDAAFAALAL